MSKALVLFAVTLGLVLIPSLSAAVALAQGNVTFQVDMRVKMKEGAFQPGSGDIVRVAGSFNDWGNSTDTLSDGNSDSIYTKTITLSEGGIQYKFLKTLRSGSDWEGGDNKSYTVTSGSQTIPVVYFDNDSVVTPAAEVSVTFQVNMKVKILEEAFQPQNGDIVRVAGSFNNWGSSTDTLTDSNNDSIYTKTVTLTEFTTAQYKFLKTPRGGSDWEDGGNREYSVPSGGGTVPVAYFNYDSVINTPINANILFQLDMRAYEELGWFRPDLGDTVQVRGPFNGWSGTVMEPNPFTVGIYELLVSYSGTSFDNIQYKYFMDLDTTQAVIRFPDWNEDKDAHNYEHPADRGDGNRIFNVGTGGNVSAPSHFFSSINPSGIIPAGDSVTVTFKVNMGPATREAATPFVPATDTVILVIPDRLTVSAQKKNQNNNFFRTWKMEPVTLGDSVYYATFTMVGPAHYNFIYGYRYVQLGGNPVSEGAGLGAQNGYRSRYIQPTAPKTFPSYYEMPQDSWQKNPPMPAEVAPYAITDVLPDESIGHPTVFALQQNYPNPFNPSTRISYSVPERVHVSLKIFNVLGQEIATLIDREQESGNYVALFETQKLPSGLYFYRLEAGSFKEVKKMILMR